MQNLLLRIAPEDNTLAEWLVTDEHGTELNGWEKGPLSGAAQQAQRRRVIWLAPSESILLTQVEIPNRTKKQLRKAVPYALEEELAEDVDNLHFALGAQNKNQATAVAVVSRELMRQWLDMLEQAGITSQRMLPDALLLPQQSGRWSVLIEAQRCLVRLGPARGFACAPPLLALLLESALEGCADAPPEGIDIYQCGGETPSLEQLQIDILEQACEHGPMALFAQGLKDAAALNLLQDSYTVQTQYAATFKPWRAVGALALTWLVLAFTAQAIENRQLAKQKKQLATAIDRVVRQSIPGLVNVVDARAQLSQELASLRGEAGAGDNRFLDLLSSAAQAIDQSKDISVEAVNFRAGRLDLDLQASGPSALDELKQKIEHDAKVKAELQSVSTSGKTASGRLRLGSGE